MNLRAITQQLCKMLLVQVSLHDEDREKSKRFQSFEILERSLVRQILEGQFIRQWKWNLFGSVTTMRKQAWAGHPAESAQRDLLRAAAHKGQTDSSELKASMTLQVGTRDDDRRGSWASGRLQMFLWLNLFNLQCACSIVMSVLLEPRNKI